MNHRAAEIIRSVIDEIDADPLSQGPFLSAGEVAEMLGVGRNFVKRTFQHSFTVGSRRDRRYSRPMVERWVRQHRAGDSQDSWDS